MASLTLLEPPRIHAEAEQRYFLVVAYDAVTRHLAGGLGLEGLVWPGLAWPADGLVGLVWQGWPGQPAKPSAGQAMPDQTKPSRPMPPAK